MATHVRCAECGSKILLLDIDGIVVAHDSVAVHGTTEKWEPDGRVSGFTHTAVYPPHACGGDE
jgi:hypothetical protein